MLREQRQPSLVQRLDQFRMDRRKREMAVEPERPIRRTWEEFPIRRRDLSRSSFPVVDHQDPGHLRISNGDEPLRERRAPVNSWHPCEFRCGPIGFSVAGSIAQSCRVATAVRR